MGEETGVGNKSKSMNTLQDARPGSSLDETPREPRMSSFPFYNMVGNLTRIVLFLVKF